MEWIDTFSEQCENLRSVRRCGEKAETALPQSSVFIHYPWARRIVRTLPRDEFIELRTSRNQHKITREEQQRLAGKAVGIVGLSVGQSVAFALALERACGQLRLADFDRIDLSNLNRLRCGLHHLGINKAIVAAREIAELDPYLDVRCFTEGYRDDDAAAFLDGLDLVVEECDSLDVKVAVRRAARARGIAVLMNSSDRGITDIERFDLEPERPLFHGRVRLPDADTLSGLATAEKIPLVLDILGMQETSPRLRASMLEIGRTIDTWPQLGADVLLGGAVVCDVARRLLLGEEVASGRFHLDAACVGATGFAVGTGSPDCSAETSTSSPGAPSRPEGDALDSIDRIVDDARLAPSAGNMQPWHWTRDGHVLELSLRGSRHASVLYERANLVGLGATLETALLSARCRGYQATLSALSNGGARIDLREGAAASDDERRLFTQVALRRSDRGRPTDAASLDAAALERVAGQVRDFPGIGLRVTTDRTMIADVSALVARAERLRMLDRDFHRDLHDEVAWDRARHDAAGTGLCIDSLGLSSGEIAGFRIACDPDVMAVMRDHGLGSGLGAFAEQLVRTSSAVALLYRETPARSADDFVNAGRALQRVWLAASAEGIGVCPVTSITFYSSALQACLELDDEARCTIPALQAGLAAAFAVPEQRTDFVLLRMLPQQPSQGVTARLPLHRVLTRRG